MAFGRNQQQKSSSELLQLREFAQERIIGTMMKQVSKRCTLSPEYIILVLDQHTAHLVASLNINYYELFQMNVY